MKPIIDTNKAGMSGLDTSRMAAKLHLELQADSSHSRHEASAEAQRVRRREMLAAEAAKLTPYQIKAAQNNVDAYLDSIEPSEQCYYCLVDLDCFFCAVEIADDPRLAGLPMAVGHIHGVISAASYEARRFGVRSGQATFQSMQLCPQLILKDTRMDAYKAYSEKFMDVLKEFDPNPIAFSLDEALIDITDHVIALAKVPEAQWPSIQLSQIEQNQIQNNTQNVSYSYPSPSQADVSAELLQRAASFVVRHVRARIFDRAGITASAGAATNSAVAKIAADINKPDGQTVVAPGLLPARLFLAPLPTRKIWGCGAVLAADLASEPFCVHTIGDIWKSRGLIRALMPPSAQSLLFEAVALSNPISLVNGRDESAKENSDGEGKTIGAERTFAPTSDVLYLTAVLAKIAMSVSKRVVAAGRQATAVVLKVKTSDFQVHQRRIPLSTATSTVDGLSVPALQELGVFTAELGVSEGAGGLGVRLVGLRATEFTNTKCIMPPLILAHMADDDSESSED